MPTSARMINREALATIMDMCEERYQHLIKHGCSENVAADRTFDALQAAYGEVPSCFDKRDRMFEAKLREVAERSAHAHQC